MLTSATALRDALVKLDDDVGLLRGRRVALLGFRDPNATRVDDNIRTLKAAAGWTVIDVRSPASPRDALAATLGAPKLAMLVGATATIPIDASLLIRALHDDRDTVRWQDGTQAAIPENRILYVVASGARSIDDLPPVLARIDYMTFIKAPE